VKPPAQCSVLRIVVAAPSEAESPVQTSLPLVLVEQPFRRLPTSIPSGWSPTRTLARNGHRGSYGAQGSMEQNSQFGWAHVPVALVRGAGALEVTDGIACRPRGI
jgi:hypothetical protein